MRRFDRVGGTATILVTDLVGSTAMFDRLGDDRAERLLREHLGELRGLVGSFGGREVKSTGDGIMAAFPAAWLATECAVAMQRSLHQRNEGSDEPLHIRIGLHSGDTTADRHDHYGIAVAVAARLCDKAAPDEVLVSGVTRGLVGSRGGHSFADAGVPALKGIDEPVQAWSLQWGPGQLPPATPPGLERRRGPLVVAVAGGLLLAGLGAGLVVAGGDDPRPAPSPAPVAGGDVLRVSVRRNGDETTGTSLAGAISGDASAVAYQSTATDLVGKDENGAEPDVFHVLLDDGLRPGSLLMVSRHGDVQGNAASTEPSISDDGNVVGFLSDATNFDGRRDRNGEQDVFMHLVDEGTTSRVSISTGGAGANGPSFEVDVSGDGNFIAFTTAADNIAVQGDDNERDDIFVRDVVEEKTNRANIRSETLDEANEDSSDPSISADGHYVAFSSTADTLSRGDTNNSPDVFRYNRGLFATVRASLASGTGSNASGASSQPSISDDGKRIAFVSTAENLAPEDTTGDPDVFVYDFEERRTIVVTAPVSPRGTDPLETANPVISGDGRFVAFDSSAPNLVPDDTNGVRDVFVYDLVEEEMVRVSVDERGREVSEPSVDPSLSTDGSWVTFTSAASLVATDSNEVGDVYLRGPLY